MTPYEEREQQISQLSGGKGWAFLTAEQKKEIDNTQFNTQLKDIPQSNAVGMLSSPSGVDSINEAQKKLATISPQVQSSDKQPSPSKVNTSEDYGNVIMLNPETGQKQSILNSPENRTILFDRAKSGWVLESSDTPAPDFLTTPAEQLTPQRLEFEKSLAEDEKEYQEMKGRLQGFAVSDAELQGEIDAIMQQYATKKREMADLNNRRAQTVETLGIRMGMQYTGGTGGAFGGVITEENRQAQQRIEELDAEVKLQIARAKEAQRSKNWDVYVQEVNLAEQKRTEKRAAIEKYNQGLAAEVKAIAEEKQELVKHQQDEFDRQMKLAPSYAAKISAEIEQIAEPEAKDAYIKSVANLLGFDPLLLAGEVEKATQSRGQKELQALATQSLIASREAAVAARELQQAMKEKQGAQGLYDTLDFRTANAVLSEKNKFNGMDIVKRFGFTIDAKNVVSSISPDSKNPADHQTVIYTFAKALDPESVVREGEYATVKKYAQSLVNRYGKEISNAINGTGFLSAQAISDIKKSINNLYTSRLPQYNSLFNTTAQTIDNIAGRPVADEVMYDFRTGAVSETQEVKIRDQYGNLYTIDQEELEQALQEGYTRVE